MFTSSRRIDTTIGKLHDKNTQNAFWIIIDFYVFRDSVVLQFIVKVH